MKVLNVVKPPQKPTASSKRTSRDNIVKSDVMPYIIPNTKHPNKFTVIVPNGNDESVVSCTILDKR